MIVYQDLLDSGLSLSAVFFACRAYDKKRNIKKPLTSLNSLYAWANQGIPARFLRLITNLLVDDTKRKADKAATAAARAPQVDIFTQPPINQTNQPEEQTYFFSDNDIPECPADLLAHFAAEDNVREQGILSNKNNDLTQYLSGYAPALVTPAKSQSTILAEDVQVSIYALHSFAISALFANKYVPIKFKNELLSNDLDNVGLSQKMSQEKFVRHFDKYYKRLESLNLPLLLSFVSFEENEDEDDSGVDVLYSFCLYYFAVYARLFGIATVKHYEHSHLKHYFKLLKPFTPPPVEPEQLPNHLVRYRYLLHDTARSLLPDTRLRACQHYPLGHKDKNVVSSGEYDKSSSKVGIKYHPTLGTTSFFGLQSCGSVWSCPICSNTVSSYRGNELAQAMDIHTAASKAFRKQHGKKWNKQLASLRDFGVTSFVTRTIPHHDHHSLEFILDAFRLADKKLKEHRNYKKLMSLYGVIGSVKIYELTVGVNGWHLHVHEVYFHKSERDCIIAASESSFFDEDDIWYETLRFEMYPLWCKSAESAGFDSPSFKHGLQVQNGDFAADYVAKFGKEPESMWLVDKEMSRSHIKTSRKGLSPFDLLRQYQATGDKMYSELFIDYAQTMSGARQMMWSGGLKEHFGIFDKTDEEISAEDQDIEAFEMLVFTKQEWKKVTRYHLKADVLLMAKYDGADAVKNYLKKFR